ncbi:endonuclease domain-containing protein [Candidatus Peregrinibacteria bacterium]|nr:endonuclease domain-containing protein [Candidatus Peregrinibacteria bacterium]
MKSYSTFIFDSYSFDPVEGQIELRYALDDGIRFIENLAVPHPRTGAAKNIDAALFALHLIGGISYYKTFCPKTIEIRSGTLNETQARFWNTVYEKGLGEFWYKNKMDGKGLVNFPVSEKRVVSPQPSPSPSPLKGRGNILLPIGGGKDSIVTLEMLREQKPTLFRMGSHPVITEIATVADLPLLTVERTLDPQLFDLNEQGALNGHVPITCYLSCLCTVIAELYGFDQIAMSCEKSANEGNVEYLGTKVNHQWSKSEEFEHIFQEYIRTFIDSNLKYWSPVRHMTELEIVKEFAKHPQYFHYTTSCNKNWKIISPLFPHGGERGRVRGEQKLWCNQCPKCAFVFALYAAYLPKERVLEIFGENLFEKKDLIPIYRQLLGLEGCKPFECVGTPEETREAFRLAEKNGFSLPIYAHT